MAPKFTQTQIAQHVLKIKEIVKSMKAKNTLPNFTAVRPEDVEKKLARVNSPVIIAQSWNNTVQGGSVPYVLGIYNPDPTPADPLFAHVWVGSGNADPTVGTFLSNVDVRFPRLTEPGFPGLTIAPSSATTLTFDLAVPTTVEKTHYLGNSCLMQVNWHDAGTYLDRGVFPFGVS